MATAERRAYQGAKRGPKLRAGKVRASKIDFRCTEDYKAWVERFAASRGETPAALIGQALKALASRDRFGEAPIR